MKNQQMEFLAKSLRQYHRSHPWRLSRGGLYIPHSYEDMSPTSLSRWDDVGFILNGRRIIVWWQHPRHVYADEVAHRAHDEVGTGPEGDWLTEGATPIYKTVGNGRKKITGYRTREISTARQAYYESLSASISRVAQEGIDFEVRPAWKWERLKWAMGVSLVAPLEVRNELDLAEVAALAKKLISQKTTLQANFPEYIYGRQDWLREQETIA
jgi:hypothetical protein